MDRYQLFVLRVSPIATNCYILVDEETKKAAVIDPGASADKIMAQVEAAGAEVACIINTHGHWDHTGANRDMQERTGAPLLVHTLDAPMLQDRNLCSAPRWLGDITSTPNWLLEEGDVVEVGSLQLKVLHTPGHSPGSICLQTEDLLFTGDTLFYRSCGRTDLMGGSYEDMMLSMAKLKQLEGDYTVLPGHEDSSTLAFERENNPYMPR